MHSKTQILCNGWQVFNGLWNFLCKCIVDILIVGCQLFSRFVEYHLGVKWWKLPFFTHFMDYKMWGINWEGMGSKEDKVRMLT